MPRLGPPRNEDSFTLPATGERNWTVLVMAGLDPRLSG
jgi:hypothetical protein